MEASTTYTLNVRQIDGRYHVTIPEIKATATGATFQEAIENAQRAIILAAMEAAKHTAKAS